jgi:RNA polymerase sigma-70 factor (ECF subfamily)
VASPQAASQELWPDEAIVRGLRQGDPDAGEQLYDCVERAVHFALIRALGPSDAELRDVTQLVFERLINSIVSGTFAESCSLRSWASLIANRTAIDLLRSRRRERNIFEWRGEAEEPRSFSSVGERPDELVERQRRMTELRDELAALPLKYAEAVVLHDVLGHELSEIAQMVGVSVSAAQSRLVRGRARLQERLSRNAARRQP